jgi:hypothetical protein
LANQVFVDGKMMMEARWPNLADSDDLLNRADFRPIAKDAWTAGAGGTAILRDSGIPEIPGGWAGGTIWYIGWYQPQSSTIAASSAGQIEFPSKAPEKFRDSYYLTGKLGALDAEKEWFYDGTKLYLWAPGGGPPANVEVKRGTMPLTSAVNRTSRSGIFTCLRPRSRRTPPARTSRWTGSGPSISATS